MGIRSKCSRIEVWNAVIDLIAYTIFGESFWDKKYMFSSQFGIHRRECLKNFDVSPNYWDCRLPERSSLSQEQIHVTFKKLLTMSKTLWNKQNHDGNKRSNENTSLCFCSECIAEREQIPLRFKLQYFDEQLEEKRKTKHFKKNTKNKNEKKRKNCHHSTCARQYEYVFCFV